ncbi:MAG: hypothetical protein V7749_13925 [Cocleimonas sp.]
MNNKVQITLLTSQKSGVLSAVMLKADKFGLKYQRNQSEWLTDNRFRMIIYFNGSLNCTQVEFIDAMESHPEIHTVEDVSLGNNSD